MTARIYFVLLFMRKDTKADHDNYKACPILLVCGGVPEENSVFLAP